MKQLKTNKMKLLKVETGKKSAKFLYSIIDENGNVILTRSSKREYVAATICGRFFFGRLDLIGKGDHGVMLKDLTKCIERNSKKPLNEKEFDWMNETYGEQLERCKKTLINIQTIAK